MIPSGMKFPNGIMPKGKGKKMAVKVFIGVVLLITALIIYDSASASRYESDTTINNYYPANMTIIAGVSDKDLAEGLAGAMAAGAHQFDFSTSEWQGSITGSKQLSDDEEGGVSFAVGKRFKETFMPNILMHFTYTPIGSQDFVIVGGTFRF